MLKSRLLVLGVFFALMGLFATPVVAQTEASYGEQRLYKKLERNFKRYHKNLQYELADYEFLQNQLKSAKEDPKLRKVLIEDYEDYLNDLIADAPMDQSGAWQRAKLAESIKQLNVKSRTKEGQLWLLDQYSEQLAEGLVQNLDGFYRAMILEIESYGNYELARALMESKKEINSADITEAMSQLLSRENLSFTREILDKKIQDAGGFKNFRKSMRAERRKNLKWGCVAMKVLAGTAVIPFSYAAMQMGVMTAPLFMGQFGLIPVSALVGSLGSFTVSAASIRKLISGCHREIHQYNEIDGFVNQQ